MTDVEIGLVSCTKSKRDSAVPPRELYQPSALFRKASTHAERNHDDWYILSAKHGLLAPDGPAIEPYDETLTDATVAERETWAKRVETQLRDADLLRDDVTLVFHAGRKYTEPLTEDITDAVADIRIPTEGLPFGKTLAWYNEQQGDDR